MGRRVAREQVASAPAARRVRSLALLVGVVLASSAVGWAGWNIWRSARTARAVAALRPVADEVAPEHVERRAALEVADRLLRDFPTAPEALYVRARILLRHGYGDEAVASLRAALAVEPGLAQAYELLAIEAMARGDHAAAVPLVERAIELDPESASGGLLLGESLNNLGRPHEAVTVLERFIAAHPRVAAAYIQLGQARGALQEPARAKEAHLAALGIEPDNGPATFGVAQACERLGERDLADHYRQRHLDLVAAQRRVGQRRIREGAAAGEAGGALAAACDLASRVYAANDRPAEAARLRARAAASGGGASEPAPSAGSRR